MRDKALLMPPVSFLLLFFLSLSLFLLAKAYNEHHSVVEPLVRKDERRELVVTENGEVSAIEISDGIRGRYHLRFITLDPNSLFLPVLLHADMVFYVHTGSGRLSWTDDIDEMKKVNLRGGDVYRLEAGSIFYVQSSLKPERQKLRIYAIFANTDIDVSYEPSNGAYSSVGSFVRGFDKEVLKAAFKVPEDLIKEITKGTPPPAIVHWVPTKETNFWEMETRFLKSFLVADMAIKDNKKTFNILEADPDFKNSNGWSLTVTKKKLHSLKGSNIGLFMVNLTKGSMMGPHWNPMANEIAIVLQGKGMVRVLCSSTAKKSGCKDSRFKVKEGDVFAVPRFHPMAQISFNDDAFVFMGFSTTTKKNHPQFLAGKSSVIQILDKNVLAMSFNVTHTTIDQFLSKQPESVILGCDSCAEEEQRLMEEEEAKEREEEEARKREEEKKREEEEVRKREDEKKREEEKARKREEEKEREEEARREQDEARKREEAKREQEEAKKREEEKKREREQEEEGEGKREQEEARKREEEKRKEREEEAEREQEEARREEDERKRREEGEKGRKEEEPERESTREEEEREKRVREEEEEEEKEIQRQEEARREEDERKRREEGEKGRKEEEPERESTREEEEKEIQRQEEEAEEARKKEDERKRREEGEKERKEEPERETTREREAAAAESEQEEARRQEDQRREAWGKGGQEQEPTGRQSEEDWREE